MAQVADVCVINAEPGLRFSAVDFELSADQAALGEAAGALLEGVSPLPALRRLVESEDAYDADLWHAIAEQGWLAVEVPEEEGGLGLGMVEVAVLAEQIGRRLAPVPVCSTLLVCSALRASVVSGEISPSTPIGSRDAASWLDLLAGGGCIGAVAWSRDMASVRASALTPQHASSLTREHAPEGTDQQTAEHGRDRPGRWMLYGRSDLVVNGPIADFVVVAATEDGQDEPSLFALAVEPDERPRREPAMDRTRSVSWLDLAGREAVRLGRVESVEALTARASVAVSAEMLGAAERVLEMTVSYAKDRVQFGRPIGSFQAVKHRCADMLVDVEGMRSAVYYAAWCVGAMDADAQAAASVAKMWCSDAARRVMASGLQVHGGIGFTWEHDLHLFLKRSQLDQSSYGDATWHRDRLAGLLRERVGAGASLF
jgi:alkylation response protein AidB-like acyl-CoA dehydrogenase